MAEHVVPSFVAMVEDSQPGSMERTLAWNCLAEGMLTLTGNGQTYNLAADFRRCSAKVLDIFASSLNYQLEITPLGITHSGDTVFDCNLSAEGLGGLFVLLRTTDYPKRDQGWDDCIVANKQIMDVIALALHERGAKQEFDAETPEQRVKPMEYGVPLRTAQLVGNLTSGSAARQRAVGLHRGVMFALIRGVYDEHSGPHLVSQCCRALVHVLSAPAEGQGPNDGPM